MNGKNFRWWIKVAIVPIVAALIAANFFGAFDPRQPEAPAPVASDFSRDEDEATRAEVLRAIAGTWAPDGDCSLAMIIRTDKGRINIHDDGPSKEIVASYKILRLEGATVVVDADHVEVSYSISGGQLVQVRENRLKRYTRCPTR